MNKTKIQTRKFKFQMKSKVQMKSFIKKFDMGPLYLFRCQQPVQLRPDLHSDHLTDT